MADESDGTTLECATYTHARRHPMVVGQIGGWSPPFQLTLPQLGILVVGFVVEARTWSLWLGYLPGLAGIVVAAILPGVLAWAARHARVEGRSLARAAAGASQYLWAPRRGLVGGRPQRTGRAVAMGSAVTYLEAGEVRP